MVLPHRQGLGIGRGSVTVGIRAGHSARWGASRAKQPVREVMKLGSGELGERNGVRHSRRIGERSAREGCALACVLAPAQCRGQEAEDCTTQEEGPCALRADCREGNADQEGTKGGNRGGEADGATGLTCGHDHGHLLEGTCVAEAGEQEHEQHERYEDVEISPALGVVENPRNTAEGDSHTNAGDEGPDCTTHTVAEDTPRHADERTDERAEEGEGRAQDGQTDRGGTTELVVDEQAEDCGESGEQAEGHHVENGHVPGVRVREDIQLLLDVGLNRNITQVDEGEDRREDAPRDEEFRGVVDPDVLTDMVAGHLLLRGQPGHTEEAEAHEDGADQLDDRHAEVANAALQAERRAGQTLGEEVAGRGHVAGECPTADATHKGQGQQDPVGGGVVLDNVEPTQHGDHEEQ